MLSCVYQCKNAFLLKITDTAEEFLDSDRVTQESNHHLESTYQCLYSSCLILPGIHDCQSVLDRSSLQRLMKDYPPGLHFVCSLWLEHL